MGHKDIEAKREYQRRWMAQRRAEWFEGKSCVDCDSTEELELDHVDPTTKVDHRVWSWTRERREAELIKCVARCRDHHQRKTAEENRERNGGSRHGTDARYSKYGCRCDPCRAARAEKKAATRARRKELGLSRQ